MRVRRSFAGQAAVLMFGFALCVAAQNQAPRPARQVPPARIVDFTAKPESVKAGQQVVLTWATENPNNVTIDPGEGKVSARGIRQVFPSTTTTYTLTVTGPNNSVLKKTVTVTVEGAAASTAAKN